MKFENEFVLRIKQEVEIEEKEIEEFKNLMNNTQLSTLQNGLAETLKTFVFDGNTEIEFLKSRVSLQEE